MLTDMPKLKKLYTVASIGYVIAVVVIYFRGGGLLTAVLTMPGWLLTGLFALAAASVSAPDSLVVTALSSVAGNLVLLLLSAAINIVGIYLLIHVLHT